MAVDQVLAVGDRVRRCSSVSRWRGSSPASTSPAAAVVRALCTLSMVLPPVVGGVALFFSFGRRGLFGQYLDRWFDFRLPFTTWGVVVAQTFVAMPFLVLTVEAALRQLDRRYRGRGAHAGWLALVRVPAGDAADRPSGADRRRGARVGTRAR